MKWLHTKWRAYKDWRFTRLVARCEKKRHPLTPLQVGDKWGKGCVHCKYFVELNRAEFRRVFGCSPRKFKDAFEKRTGEKFLDITRDTEPQISDELKNRPVN